MTTLLIFHAKLHVAHMIIKIKTACMNGKIGISEILIKMGVDVDILNNYGKSSLHLASEEGHADTVQMLILRKLTF